MIGGYGTGEASALAPSEYFRLPFAMVYGFMLFAELPDLYTLLGASILVGSTLYIARRESTAIGRSGRGHLNHAVASAGSRQPVREAVLAGIPIPLGTDS